MIMDNKKFTYMGCFALVPTLSGFSELSLPLLGLSLGLALPLFLGSSNFADLDLLLDFLS